jgi:C1A family cysteine protease
MKPFIIQMFLWLSIFLFACCNRAFCDTIQVSSKAARIDSIKDAALDSMTKYINDANGVIKNYKELQKDMLATEVFEKSKSYLIGWITFSGIIILILTIIGYSKLISYMTAEIKKKVDSLEIKNIQEIAETEIKTYIQVHLPNLIPLEKIGKDIEKAGKKSFDLFVVEKKEEMELVVKQLKDSAETLKSPLSMTLSEKESVSLGTENVIDSIDYSADMNGVRDQGPEGGVVGFALAYCMEYYIKKDLDKKIILSPRYIYNMTRQMENTLDFDAGALIKDAIKLASTQGVVTEKVWPYKAGELSKKPPEGIDKEPHFFIKGYARLKSADELKKALIAYGPAIIGVTVYQSFMAENDGHIKMPAPTDTIIGGHAICIVGYNDSNQKFKFINSWGRNWGDKGYGYIPSEYVDKFSDDGWLIKSVIDKNPKRQSE